MQGEGRANQQLEQSVALVKALLLCVGLRGGREVQKEGVKGKYITSGWRDGGWRLTRRILLRYCFDS